MKNLNNQNRSFLYFLRNIYYYFLISIKFIKNNLNFVFIGIIINISPQIIDLSLEAAKWGFPILEKIFYLIFLFIIFIIFEILIINYLHKKEGFSLQKFKSDIKKQFFLVTKVNIIMSLHIFVGTLFFIVPGIIIALSYTFIIYFTICYNQPFETARENSMKLMDGYKFYFFLLYIVLFCFIFIVGFSLELPFSFTDKPKILKYALFSIEYGISYLTEIITYTVIYLFWKDRVKNSNTQEEH